MIHSHSPYQQAMEMQQSLREKIVLRDTFDLRGIRFVAGADLCFAKEADIGFAVILVLSLPEMKIVEQASAVGRISFPYIPGLLSFRELPLLCEAYDKLQCKPDVLICDGQGLAHPRRFGLACHLGLELDVPTVGAAKSRLVGEYTEPASPRGSHSALIHQGERVGEVVRTRDRVKPMFISPGHKVGFETAVELVLRLTPRYRVPEPTRQADQRVACLKRDWLAQRAKNAIV
ncbi:MAG TPA: deoxyribonuclease V [bacterium]|nr:deoxyribonuclease V [bacterium]